MAKRAFDVFFSLLSLLIVSPVLLITWLVLAIATQSKGLFFQKRVGQFGKLFTIIKLQTMHPVTAEISLIGYYVRKYKLDELPQFLNVLIGDMSIVGPRPDMEGYYDLLEGENRKILALKPGITSEASIKYRNEDAILSQQENPLDYNDKIIFPDKVKMNLNYFYHHTFLGDLKIIYKTLFGISEE